MPRLESKPSIRVEGMSTNGREIRANAHYDAGKRRSRLFSINVLKCINVVAARGPSRRRTTRQPVALPALRQILLQQRADRSPHLVERR